MLFTLKNHLTHVRITTYGARMVSITTADHTGKLDDILLGFDDIATYENAGGSFGAIIGRYANRIANASFELDGQTHHISKNDNNNTLHGGSEGFSRKEWQPVSFKDGLVPELTLTINSPAGDQGFPGNLSANATYKLEAETLTLTLTATTDAPTIINLTSHPYFNLAGIARHDILDHEITINADIFLPTNALQIPTGERRRVAGTVFDFRTPKSFSENIRLADPQVLAGRGYDHCFALNKSPEGGLQFAARAVSRLTGRAVDVHTTQPGLQLYSGNSLDGSISGRDNTIFRQSCGFAFEAQNFPDAPHQPDFPSSVLRPGQMYKQVIAYKFSII
jgi:aldose 1-epimerase